uniref:Asparaginase n=1 Tax=Rhodosorus marinus TaxID=101924 RepID=A0A7S3E7Q8_9RHOD|mmetsp:Transcript_12860/g.51421  ORF Transcript_12860/g.51421 Transcript_12860/m.51421 type:complete len:329 (+) Transcript_12860:339-1325(+)
MGASGYLPIVVVHGGAWNIPEKLLDGSEEGARRAATAGMESLRKSPNDALAAVEAAVKVLEDDPVFDAGTGSCLTADRSVEMDAILMDGSTLKTGAVAAVKNIRNPISLAKMVLDTSHCLLVGEGADKFAREMGVPEVAPEKLVSEDAVRDWERHDSYDRVVANHFMGHSHDTVGCAVLTRDGHFACGTSTGGITRKRVGRVGDSPLIGCGAYCEDGLGAASATGHGESIMKVSTPTMCDLRCWRLLKVVVMSMSVQLVLSRRALFNMENGKAPKEAASAALQEMKSKTGGEGGLIIIGPDGSVAHEFTTPHMPWAVCRGEEGITSGI